ncbi:MULTISPECIES: hypothetical protein [Rhizobium]|uniref:Uncharacterized protein n=1 Tax=Rhizobium favelukesii TaxID=348824 RepID=W6RSA8_9HYPH|nr:MULTISPECIES: hypothetical protein [Rhizobium]MCA0805220.1 hypothetical protein [Rhizobium sp. T1473]MCS0463838.1 hypothetical protein [Rhizobium favelukesii]UFS79449.1 hypothetical protein LPB79_07690 [Rhizobium sp. T136]CDM63025.1 hypothetical protein LPU83_pLPU83d_1655 [Rhizobium favelukesii]
MNDIDRPTLQRAPTLVGRKCHCGDWAGFGFVKGERDDWWCWKHYPYKTSARLGAALEAAALAQSFAAKVA